MNPTAKQAQVHFSIKLFLPLLLCCRRFKAPPYVTDHSRDEGIASSWQGKWHSLTLMWCLILGSLKCTAWYLLNSSAILLRGETGCGCGTVWSSPANWLGVVGWRSLLKTNSNYHKTKKERKKKNLPNFGIFQIDRFLILHVFLHLSAITREDGLVPEVSGFVEERHCRSCAAMQTP